MVLFTGALEVLLGAGLLFPATQYYAGWGLMILLVAMFSANIRVTVLNLPAFSGLPSKPWYHLGAVYYFNLFIFYGYGGPSIN